MPKFLSLCKKPYTLSAVLAPLIGLSFAFQNCSKGSNDTASLLSSQSASILLLAPLAATVAPQGTIQFSGSGGLASSYRFSVIGTGSIDEISGLYTAPATANDDIVRMIDSSGSAVFSFVKVASAGSPVGLNPPALLIAFQNSFQFIATGGTPPFTYSLSSASFGTIDSSSGVFNSTNSAGQVTVTATDANGLTASSVVKIQEGAPTTAPIYAPNPLAFGQVAAFFLSDATGESLQLQSGPGSVNGLTYSPGYQVGPANLTVINGSWQVPLQIPLSFVSSSLTCVHGKQVFNYTGADQVFIAPANCPSVTVKLWGAGGTGCGGNYGGGGGFASATLFATETAPVGAMTIIVGQAGPDNPSIGAYGGGGIAFGGGGGGGGRSAVRINNVEVLTAGGGGGGVYDIPWAGNQGVMDTGVGGAGGGLTGQAGSIITWEPGVPWTGSNGPVYNGGGGTQSAGGSSASGPGSQFLGGNSFWGAPSGGGGYYGGGAGGAPWVFDYANKGGAGGGSSYIGGGGQQPVANGVTIGGSGPTPGNTSDPDYVSGTGMGSGQDPTAGHYTVGTVSGYPLGGNGLVVISW